MRIKRKRRIAFHGLDWPYLLVLISIIVFGLVMLASVGVSVGYEKYGDSNFFLKNQLLFGVLPGLVLMIGISFIDYHFWEKFAKYGFVLSVILLILIFIPGLSFNYGGASRWVKIGGIFFQPSEIVKLLFLVFLANWLSKQKDHVNEMEGHFFPFAVLISTIAGLVLLQPDMGTAFMIVSVSLVMYFIADGNLLYLTTFSAVGGGLFLLLIKTESYRMKRLTTFLNPELDPLGVGYHINQALLAVGSGGLWGRGYGLSRQKFMYLPEVVNDSIFAIIAEELGFIVVIVLIGLFVWFFLRGCKISEHAPDLFGKLLGIGISSWIIIQVLVNIGAMLSLLPITGITLPFISYGRSSLIMSLVAIGVVINISKQTKKNKLAT